MYQGNIYRNDDIGFAKTIISDYPLSLIVSKDSEEFFSSHIPLVWKETASKSIQLVGHLDNNNSQLLGLNGADVLAVFSGPDSYISPSDYVTQQLPTWNYIRLHAYGTAAVTSPGVEILKDIDDLAAQLECGSKPWRLDHSLPHLRNLSSMITRLVITVRKFEGRFKLSQEKAEKDRRAALKRLLMERDAKKNANIKRIALSNT
ncbi:FMN-binding negative transcriptional regulator [Denitrobaculum tricleocarpae]|uniref:FMN-binding negative transcriptional regulator n=1 Tax=Denitrobaculum tricleocarpae TaxID=2591009 RepID=A0A545U1F5_9PROT|nr:FMN-binding negative transcriptional regulator [Denitrobaculum tricleocarpae]TQV83317.1 FMN-binding negative transcriptional regulator [Denitrobaculum tricleocarpae]